MKRVQINLQANLHLVPLWNEQRRFIASPLSLMEERANLVCVCVLGWECHIECFLWPQWNETRNQQLKVSLENKKHISKTASLIKEKKIRELFFLQRIFWNFEWETFKIYVPNLRDVTNYITINAYIRKVENQLLKFILESWKNKSKLNPKFWKKKITKMRAGKKEHKYTI